MSLSALAGTLFVAAIQYAMEQGKEDGKRKGIQMRERDKKKRKK